LEIFMVNWQTDYAKGIRPVPTPQGGEVVSIRAAVAVTTALASADIIEFAELPHDCVPVDFVLDVDDMDSGAALAISVGLLNTGKTDLSTAAADGGAVWIATSSAAQTGVIARPTTKSLWRVTPATSDRMVGAKITTVAATAVAGTIAGVLSYRASHYSQ